MLPPLVLRPPLGPRVLRVLLMLLAGILHLGTAGWGLIANGREGDLAGAARQLLINGEWVQPESPAGPILLQLTKASMHLFGVRELAVRLPSAVAVMIIIWFTMRIGERLGGIWRGFCAGMILLCTPGMFTMARALTPAPVEAACVVAACYALVCGYLHREGRRGRFALAWLALGCGFLAGGWKVVLIPLGATLWSCLASPTARLRFRGLVSWEAGGILALTAVVAWAFGHTGYSPASPAVPVTAAWRIAAWQGGLFFPWSLLVLPALMTLVRRVCSRFQSFEWSETFLLAWVVIGLLLAMGLPNGSLFDSMLVWPAMALWCAAKLEVTPHRSLLWAISGVLAVAMASLTVIGMMKRALTWFFPAMIDFIYAIPQYLWLSIASVVIIAIIAFVLFTAAALTLEIYQHRRLAVVAFFAAMVPGAYAVADASARFAPFFSYADIGECINMSRIVPHTIWVDESRFSSTSLHFYLSPSASILQQAQLSPDAIDPGAEPSFIVTRRTRLPQWQERFPKSAILCESGGSVLLATQGKE